MKITEQWLIEHHACRPAIKLFNGQGRSAIDSDEVLNYLVKSKRFPWALWLVEELLPEKYKSEFVNFYTLAVRKHIGIWPSDVVLDIIVQYGRELLERSKKLKMNFLETKNVRTN
jgi:hypothetical protein